MFVPAASLKSTVKAPYRINPAISTTSPTPHSFLSQVSGERAAQIRRPNDQSSRGTPAEVVLADDRPQPAISSPFTSDDPSTPTTPSLPPSTRLSAPQSNYQASRQESEHAASNSATPTASEDSEDLPPTTTSLLGRRRRNRSPDSEDQEDLHESLRDSQSAVADDTEHRRKRRRQGSRMRAEGDNSTSNGSGPSPLHKAAVSNSANGTRRSSIAMNGSSSTNGHSNSGAKPRPPYFGHDREEVTRILIQALTDLGYDNAASSLSQESGYNLESPTVAKFRKAVLHGEWNEAEDLLFGDTLEEGGVSIGGNGLILQDGVDRNVMRFWLRQQKFLELLEQRDTGKALGVLRLELTPLDQDTSKLHFLSSLLMCQSTEDLKAKAEWDGAEGKSRHHLLSELSKCISPSVMLPERRLAILLQQVKRHQISNCLYHNTASSPSLYQDHNCDRNLFPVHPVLELDKHTGEVWHVKFSNDGSKLATCGKDGTCLIYEVGSFDVLQCLAMPETGIASVAWSPDDSMIVTCQLDYYAILWEVNTGKPIVKLPRFEQPVGACVWAPDGRSFVTGVLDKERNLCQWNTRGELIFDWGQTHRIQDLAVSPNGRHLVAMTNEKMIYVYNFITRDLEYELDMETAMCSVSISQDGRYLLVNKVDGEARILDLETRETVQVFRSDETGGKYIIRATYGGANESFVIVGSESGNINIWHKESGTLVEKLQHGKSSCNAVSWSPTDPSMFASAGDDGKVRIWADLNPHKRYSNGSRQSNGR
ncbi:hypothetical protein EG329_012595 [Mollisiaceae sp. DMI_Dod_QoI]|nr:hypothetical protein EG329_012595 [Helotiales sp. DMI_Dod_QoI]